LFRDRCILQVNTNGTNARSGLIDNNRAGLEAQIVAANKGNQRQK
jgi:hypothetical protein